MRTIDYVLIGDGTSDRALLPILAWALRKSAPDHLFAPQPFVHRGSRAVASVIDDARSKYRPDLIFVHRDAERIPLATRRTEIPTVDYVVPVVPVRMTEAWLLINAEALRKASGNPNGKMVLDLPRPREIESLPDPKRELERLLLEAAGALGPRRRKQHRQEQSSMVHRVAEYIEDFSGLFTLPAFGLFWTDLQGALSRISFDDASHTVC